MAPDLLYPLPTYPTFLIAACIFGTVANLWIALRSGIPVRPMIVLLATLAVCALAGAKLYGIGERWGGWHGLAWELGHDYRYPGGIVAALVALAILGRRMIPQASLATLGDLAMPGIGLAMVVMRLGCFLAGCCHGPPTSLPWGISFPKNSLVWETQFHAGLIDEHAPLSLPVHPLQFYLGLGSLAVAILLLWRLPRRRYAGELVLWFFLLDGTAKFLLESLRFEYAGHLQWMAAGMAVVGGTALVGKVIWDKTRGGGNARAGETVPEKDSAGAKLAPGRTLG